MFLNSKYLTITPLPHPQKSGPNGLHITDITTQLVKSSNQRKI